MWKINDNLKSCISNKYRMFDRKGRQKLFWRRNYKPIIPSMISIIEACLRHEFVDSLAFHLCLSVCLSLCLCLSLSLSLFQSANLLGTFYASYLDGLLDGRQVAYISCFIWWCIEDSIKTVCGSRLACSLVKIQVVQPYCCTDMATAWINFHFILSGRSVTSKKQRLLYRC